MRDMTTFTPLAGGKYRCNRDGCHRRVRKGMLDAHRAQHFERDRPTVRSLATALGLKTEEVKPA